MPSTMRTSSTRLWAWSAKLAKSQTRSRRLMRDEGLEIPLDLDADQRRAIAKELGDVLWYVTALAGDLGYALEDIATMNIDKLRDRKDRDMIHGSGDER